MNACGPGSVRLSGQSSAARSTRWAVSRAPARVGTVPRWPAVAYADQTAPPNTAQASAAVTQAVARGRVCSRSSAQTAASTAAAPATVRSSPVVRSASWPRASAASSSTRPAPPSRVSGSGRCDIETQAAITSSPLST